MSSRAAPPDPIRESYVPAARPEDSSRVALPSSAPGRRTRPTLPIPSTDSRPRQLSHPSPALQRQLTQGSGSIQRYHTLSVAGLSVLGSQMHMASQRVLQYVAGAKKKPPTVYLRCHVKPGASKVREGITALTDGTIELCVSAVPKDGESNKAVLAVLSEVSPSRSTLLTAVPSTPGHPTL